MNTVLSVDLPKFYEGKIFVDPLEDVVGTLNVTMVKFDKILYFAKRSGGDKYEAYVEKHNFLIQNGEEVLIRSGLNLEQYLELLLTKTSEVKERVRYIYIEECIKSVDLAGIADKLDILKDNNDLEIKLYLSAYQRDGYKENK